MADREEAPSGRIARAPETLLAGSHMQTAESESTSQRLDMNRSRCVLLRRVVEIGVLRCPTRRPEPRLATLV